VAQEIRAFLLDLQYSTYLMMHLRVLYYRDIVAAPVRSEDPSNGPLRYLFAEFTIEEVCYLTSITYGCSINRLKSAFCTKRRLVILVGSYPGLPSTIAESTCTFPTPTRQCGGNEGTGEFIETRSTECEGKGRSLEFAEHAEWRGGRFAAPS